MAALELVSILISIFGTGLALSIHLGRGLREARRDITDLGERMARLEELFTGFTQRQSSTPGA